MKTNDSVAAPLPKRKPNRLQGWDYSENGAYFVTVCTHQKARLFGSVGADSISARMVAQTFLEALQRYPTITCPQYVVMPNHFHAILLVQRADIESAPTICEAIQSFQRHSTLEDNKLVKQGLLPRVERRIWRRSYHDPIIRM